MLTHSLQRGKYIKMEITLENKAKFFAQYWGQIVAVVTKGSYTHPLGTEHVVNETVIRTLSPIVKHEYSLCLKPLLSIPDEDAIVLAGDDLCDQKDRDILIRYAKEIIQYDSILATLRPKHYQRLQSIGYALEWMGISVDEMVQADWIKLTTP